MNLELEQEYKQYRSLLFSIAYRMLGSVMDAEDIVHDVFIDWERRRNSVTDHSRDFEYAKAYLCRSVANRSIDQLRSVRRRKVHYFGPWLPEPLVERDRSVASRESDPERHAMISDSLSVAYLIMLEALSPMEKAVFILREIFAFEYEEIADMIERKPDHCRQILSRARRKISDYSDRSDFYGVKPPPSSGAASIEDPHIIARFIEYVMQGDMNGLIGLMAPDIVFVSDGGGKVSAAVHPVLGQDRVAHLVFGVAQKLPAARMAVESAFINGVQGVILWIEGVPYCTLSFSFSSGKITGIYNMMNPEKLQHIKN